MKKIVIVTILVFLCSFYAIGQRKVDRTTSQNTTVVGTTKDKPTGCTVKNAFGLDLGIGGGFGYRVNSSYDSRYHYTNYRLDSYRSASLAVGFRYMHNFLPYFGADFIKVNLLGDFVGWSVRQQWMSGIRGYTPTFGKCMSGYAVFRAGYGLEFLNGNLLDNSGFCLETEVGLNFSRKFFMGFSYNRQVASQHTMTLRLGFNFGK